MNATCSKCRTRTPHRRTQSGSWFRFFCERCETELIDPVEKLRMPHPAQSEIDRQSAELLVKTAAGGE